jgi:hypothetical protein
MIRYVEMKGIHLDAKVKSFGFYNTVSEKFLKFGGGSYVFDSVDEFEWGYHKKCGVSFDDLKHLIPNDIPITPKGYSIS